MASIIVKMLEVQNQVKIYHFQTRSYARHMASDRLYTSLLTNIDRFGEVYQRSKRIKLMNGGKLVIKNLNDKQMYSYLSNFAVWLSDELPKFLSKSSKRDMSDLLNIRDEMLADVNQTLYLFSFE